MAPLTFTFEELEAICAALPVVRVPKIMATDGHWYIDDAVAFSEDPATQEYGGLLTLTLVSQKRRTKRPMCRVIISFADLKANTTPESRRDLALQKQQAAIAWITAE